ncbi:MAG: hypothetical protein ACJAZF_002351 [Granulosicoccus sp.]|jgi:hypothetical protein
MAKRKIPRERRVYIEGELPNRASKLVKDWIQLHRDELDANWTKAHNGEPLSPIEPLE